MIVALTAKMPSPKTIVKTYILRDKYYLYGIELVHITSNDAFKARKHLQMGGY